MTTSKKSDEYSKLSEGNYAPAIYDYLVRQNIKTNVAIYFGYLIWNMEYWGGRNELTILKGKERFHLSYKNFNKDFFLGASTQYRFNNKLKEIGLIDIADKKGYFKGKPKIFHQYWVNFYGGLGQSKFLMVNFNLAFHLGKNFGMALYLARLIKKRDVLINKGGIDLNDPWFYDEYSKCKEQIGIPRSTQEDYDKKLETNFGLIRVEQKNNTNKGKLRHFFLNIQNIIELVQTPRPGYESKKNTKTKENEVPLPSKADTVESLLGEVFDESKGPDNNSTYSQTEFTNFAETVETFSEYKPPKAKERDWISPHEKDLEKHTQSEAEVAAQSSSEYKHCFGLELFRVSGYCETCMHDKECALSIEGSRHSVHKNVHKNINNDHKHVHKNIKNVHKTDIV